jgi:hypothetical protein
MENQDNTLRLHVFHGMGRDDVEHNCFTCEGIWSMKRITYEATKIAQLETTLRDIALTWYMKYKATMLVGQARDPT